MLISEKYDTSIKKMYEEAKKIVETAKKEYSSLSAEVAKIEYEIKRLEKIVREKKKSVKNTPKQLENLNARENETYSEIVELVNPYVDLGENLDSFRREKELLEELKQKRLSKRCELRKSEYEMGLLEALLNKQ